MSSNSTQDKSKGLNDGFITPRFLKSLITKCFAAYTTSDQFQDGNIEEEELKKIRIGISRLMDFFDSLKS